MHHDWTKILTAIAAAIFGWVFASLPKIVSGHLKWLEMFSHFGLAAMAGLVAYSLTTWAFPEISQPALCCIASVCGSACDRIMPYLSGLADKAARRAGGKVLNQIGPDDKDEEGKKQ